MKLGDKIYQARKKMGLSQETLSEQVGVSRQAVSKWETGDTEPDIGKLRALSKALDVSVDWLLDEEETSCSTEPTIKKNNAQDTERTWVDSLPKTIQTLVKQYGWLFGVRMAISGALFIVLGLTGRAMARSMDAMSGPFVSSEIVVDHMGRVIHQTPANPFTIITGVIIAIGIVALIAGIALAVVLKKKES